MSGSQNSKLDEVGKRYLKRERKLLIAFVILGWSLFAAATLYFWFGHFTKDLGFKPPLSGIHDQSAAEQGQKITDSELGQTGGLPLKVQIDERGDNKKETKHEQSPLDYLLDARDLNAQEGVWKASRVIAVIAFLQTIIGVAGLFLIYRTLKETQLVGNEAKKTTAQAIRATKAAVRSANAAENAERAYVFAEFETEFCGEAPDSATKEEQELWHKSRIRITPRFRNFGKSPAMEFSAKIIFDRGNYSGFEHEMLFKSMIALGNPDFPIASQEASDFIGPFSQHADMYNEINGSNFISSNGEIKIGSPFVVESIEMLDDVGAWPINYVFQAWWSYTDIFGGTPKRQSFRTDISLDCVYLDSGLEKIHVLQGVRGIKIKQTEITEENYPSKE